MSILFKGRAKGASSAKVGFIQSIVMFFCQPCAPSAGESWRAVASAAGIFNDYWGTRPEYYAT